MSAEGRSSRPTDAKAARRKQRELDRARYDSDPGPRGWFGLGGGRSVMVQAPLEWRGTTVQVCGLWPFAAGTSAPMVGVPIGRSLLNGGPVCCDPISWFQDAALLHNPSEFVLGKPGLGKSSLLRRQVLGLAGYGLLPLVCGDLKPDYCDLISALGGQVIRLGRGRGYLNILDIASAQQAAERLRASGHPRLAAEVLADARGRRQILVEALLSLARKGSVSDLETSILGSALEILDRLETTPVLSDLLAVVEERHVELQPVAMDRGDNDRYQDRTENLVVSLRGLMGTGRLGEIFSAESSVQMRRDVPVVFDVSSIDDSDATLQGAALLACWATGFATVNIAHTLAEAGLEPQRHYFVVLDELWRALRAGNGMVERVDELTRLNRQRGVGVAMCTHTMSDMLALATEHDRQKARGFVERAGFVIAGGLPRSEMEMLTQVVPMSEAEQRTLVGWQDPPAWTRAGKESSPPGRGNFLAKIGGRPGIPFHVELTHAERAVNDTNKLWHEHSRIADSQPEPLSELEVQL